MPRSFHEPHLRIEGHVHKAKSSTPESAFNISQQRAETVVDGIIASGVPASFLHPQGFGFSRMLGSPAENRRCEIHVMTPDDIDDYIKFLFAQMDSDGTCTLDEEEAITLGRKLGKTKDEVMSHEAGLGIEHLDEDLKV